ncbi:IS21 family transposase, partial [Aeromonas veronii]
AATLKQAGLALDVSTANAHIGPWLQDIANQRSHGTTGEVPAIRLQQELPHFLPLPQALPVSPGTTATARPMPLESLQHPLSVYQDLLEVNV